MKDIVCQHCWHKTGVTAPVTAPRSWTEFKCCYCGELKKAENYAFAAGTHGPHVDHSLIPNTPYTIW